MRVHIFEHATYESAGAINEWAVVRGHTVQVHDATAGALGVPTAGELLVVMGGPMSAADDAWPRWLMAEAAVIGSAIEAGATVFGVCLGAQLVASVLGARVFRNPEPEVGWWEVVRTAEGATDPVFGALPERFVAGHWHADTFATPDGAVRTLASDACPNQGFSAHDGRVVGLQCHLEWRADDVRALADACGAGLVPGRRVVTADGFVAGEAEHGANARTVLFDLLDALVCVNG